MQFGRRRDNSLGKAGFAKRLSNYFHGLPYAAVEGFDVIKEIGKKKKYDGIKIFCISSIRDNSEDMKIRCGNCHVDGFFSKPFSEQKIKPLLENS